MNRLRSKNGCVRCRLRKKKCDEKRPVCSACARWKQWRETCSYQASPSRSHSPSTIATQPATDASKDILSYQLQLIRHGGDAMESRILQTIPESIKAFFSPTSADRIRDLQTMWQLMLSNDILRNASIACFSRIVDHSDALSKLSQESYGRALKELQSKILRVDLDRESGISVIAAIVFLGKMESCRPHSNVDALEHWMPLIPLMASDRISKLSRGHILPANESTLMFESLLYHVGTQAIFSRATHRVWNLWQTHRIYQRLCIHNPDGPERLSRSALLCGQYPLYDMALHVTYLLRYLPDGQTPPSFVDELEAIIHRHNARLNHDFATVVSTTTTTEAKSNAECAIYRFFCNSLLICITALRESSPILRVHMECLVQSGMKMFLALPIYSDVPQLSEHASHFLLAAIWPIQIQACATYDDKQFDVFMDHFVKLERFMDPGHQQRARSLLDQVRECLKPGSPEEEPRRAVGQADDREFPFALKLLRHAIAVSQTTQKAITE